MHPLRDHALALTRRHFFGRAATSVGVAALATLLAEDAGAAAPARGEYDGALPGLPHFPNACAAPSCPTPCARASASPA